MDVTERIGELAMDAGIRVAAAESLTGGQVCTALGATPGASDWFAGGVVAYTIETKNLVLGVHLDIDPCSAECARTMAAGVRDALEVDAAVATTGVGGPDPQDGHAPGTVFIGWARGSHVGAREFSFEGDDPEQIVEASTRAALEMLAEILDGMSEDEDR
ncbi:nicotinamide-nucleotide amidase [Microbacterium sp. SORGH_AS428]|uniref:CinA family protein n=1 Tax=Microbacterium sp. SORGH_AS_0428 TaxID=3041788 RepID=UPI00285FCF5F|nr:CinA family protein [Microbacterium sp. SORGH_AS_0428]MDR6198167.1 nicotinamide-nucleotide amidase [Microbacterium sp. SORGH_AS_0428]